MLLDRAHRRAADGSMPPQAGWKRMRRTAGTVHLSLRSNIWLPGDLIVMRAGLSGIIYG
jgi:hypothetical protein